MERFMRSIKEVALRKQIFFGEGSLRNAVSKFQAQYHGERNHHGLANRLIEPIDEVELVSGELECHERLGGMLKYY